VVTGANQGIGFEIARQLGKAGFKTILGCRRTDAGQEAAQTLQNEGSDAHFMQLDISNKKSMADFAQQMKT
jgi:NAD(P)-dependent dehydrogenase (short-subunit alcohol dehydrogenase family)